TEGLIASAGRGGGRILGIERHQQQLLAALRLQSGDRGRRWRIAIAHGPVDDDGLRAQRGRQLFALRSRDGLERALVAFPVPDLVVVLAFSTGPEGENDEIKYGPPLEARHFDDASIRQKLLEVA